MNTATQDIADMLSDPHVSEASKQHLTVPQAFLDHRHQKADRRRFYELPESITGFDEFDARGVA